jgi:hypothetical protein
MTARVAIAISTVALGFSAAAYLSTRREKKHELFLSLWKEYGSNEMLDAMRALYQLWKGCRGESAKIVDEYVNRYRQGDSLHYQRRLVSLLYQRLAFLNEHKLIPKEFRKEWLGVSLDVIAILYPIETDAMREITKDEPELPPELDLKKVDSADQRRMFTLYNTWRKTAPHLPKRDKPQADDARRGQ